METQDGFVKSHHLYQLKISAIGYTPYIDTIFLKPPDTKLDLGLIVHCHVTLDKQTKNNFSEFEQIILQFPEVISCSLVSGNFDYFLKLVSKDVETYNKFYQEKLAVLPMVAHINSLFVMDEIKTTTELPL